ncbi:MAG: flavodoxin family protein [Coriobacteriia bacterium]|nr:flavodoxin family protein [Coriobacteriia bacterium]
MKVLLFNGSPKKKGTTARALAEVAAEIKAAGIETQTLQLGTAAVYGCAACLHCRTNSTVCRYADDVCNDLVAAAQESDGFIFGSPVYFAGANGALCAVLDRAFYSSFAHFVGKPGAGITVCRRGGASATFDRLNKYFTFAQMPIVSSQYWNMVHGINAEQAKQDLEGMQTMRVLGRNMAQLLKHIEAGKATGLTMPAPAVEERLFTPFIR